jgi:hypothetical protein
MEGFLFPGRVWPGLLLFIGMIWMEALMAPKGKRRSVMDALRDLLDKLNELGPLLKPKELQPIPVRNPDPARRRRR